MPKFRTHRQGAHRPSQRRSELDEVAEESLEQKVPGEPEDHGVLPPEPASAPVRLTPDKEDSTSPDECALLLSEASPESEDGESLQKTFLKRGRGKLERQDESIV